MTLTFDTATKKITSLNISTYMGQKKDAVTLQVQMGSLPDGTNYEQQTVLNATAKLGSNNDEFELPETWRVVNLGSLPTASPDSEGNGLQESFLAYGL